jgi:hypothetical protein
MGCDVFKQTLVTVALLTAMNAAQAVPVLSENFDDIGTLTSSGWRLVNNSTPGGLAPFFQGDAGIFSSQSGAANSYIGSNFLSSGSALAGDISNWLISPEITLNNHLFINFFTRTDLGSPFADRLEIRLSQSGGDNVGSDATSVGDFTTLLATVNPLLATGGYPEDWTQLSVSIGSVNEGTTGRFAFRYFVPDISTNGNYIGIDTLTLEVPEPGSLSLSAIALMGLGFVARRRYLAVRK